MVGVPDLNHNEVPVGFEVAETEAIEECSKPGAPFQRDLARGVDVILIVEGGESSDLGKEIDVEGLAGALKDFGRFRRGHSVTDAKAGQALGFGEGAKDGQVGMVPEPTDGVGRIEQEFLVGFIEKDGDVVRNGFEKGLKIGIGNTGSGGVVGICQEDKPGVWGNSRQDGVEVVVKLAVGRFDKVHVEQLRHELIHDEGPF